MSLNRNGFQTFVNQQLAPAVLGDFASMNPRATALAGPNAYRSTNLMDYQGNVANPLVGNFGFGQNSLVSRQQPAGVSVPGFVANELQTVIPFLAAGAGDNPVRLGVQTGFPVTLYIRGDFWATPKAPLNGAVSPGDTVYANPDDGAVTNDPVFFSATGVQALFVMTISAVTKGVLLPGMHLSGTAAGSVVVAQATGTPGGAGTYTMSVSETVGSATTTAAPLDTGFKFASATTADAVTTASAAIAAGTGVLTIGAIASGVVEVGQNITGTGVPANLFIQAQLSGTAGGAGTYQLNTIGPAVTTFTATLSQGKLAKISRS